MLNHVPMSVDFLDYLNFGAFFDIFLWSNVLELVQLGISHRLVNIEFAKFVQIKNFLVVKPWQ